MQVGTRFFRPQAGTVMMWARMDGGSGNRRMFHHRTDTITPNLISLGVNNSGQLVAGIGDKATAFTGPHIGGEIGHFALTWDNGSFAVYHNGQVIGSGSYAPFASLRDLAWLGRGLAANESWVGLLDDARVYDTALTPAAIAAIHADGWQLQAPFFFEQPAGQSVLENRPVTFSARAHGNPVPALQWYKNGVLIPGALGTTLTVHAPLADHGAVFHAVATNSVGATPSASAVLTVLPDTEPPAIRLARVMQGGAQVNVRFDEDIEAASATNPAHYSLGAGITVTGASLQGSREVVLDVSGLADGWSGQLLVDGVRDLATTPNTASATAPLAYDTRLGTHYRLDDPADGLFVDSAFRANDAPHSAAARTEGPHGAAWFFDGTGAATAPTAGLNAPEGTLSLWLRADDSSATERHAFWHRAGNSANRIGLSQRNGRLHFHIGERATIDTGRALGTGWNQAALVWKNGTHAVWLNGERVATGTHAPFASIASEMRLGGGPSGNFWLGTLDDVRLYSAALGDLEIARIHDEDTPAVAPAITLQPQSRFVAEGDTVVFSADATGLPYPTFQWQRNGLDLPGETARDLVIVASVADDGAEYQLVATNSEGFAVSQAATLGVLPDGTPPDIADVEVIHRRRLLLTFTEALDTLSATNPVNYTINGEPALEAIARGAAAVELVAAQPFIPGSGNTLVINHVTDAAPVPNPIPEDTTVAFAFELNDFLKFWYEFEEHVEQGTTEGTFFDRVHEDNLRRWFDQTHMLVESTESGKIGRAFHIKSRYFSSGLGHRGHLTGRRGTYTAWVNYDGGHYFQGENRYRAILLCETGSNRLNLVVSPDHRLRVDLGNTTETFVAAEAFPVGTWQHVALVWDHGSFQVYQNGELLHEGTYPAFDLAGVTLRLGTGPQSGFGNWKGKIDDTRIYSTSLSAADIRALHNETLATFKPFILHQPVAQSVAAGGEAVFRVIAGGEPAPAYQWRRNGTALPGANAATLVLADVTAAQAGDYDVVLTNSAGTTTSRAVSLAVVPVGAPPVVQLTAPAPGQVFMLGDTVPLAATASDPDGDLREVRFYGGDQLLATLAEAPFTHSWVHANVGPRTVRAEARDQAGNRVSDEVAIEIHAAPMILEHPADLLVSQGGEGTLRVAYTGYPVPAFQWRRNGVAIPGADGPAFTLSSAALEDGGLYDIVLQNAHGTRTSFAASVTVLPMATQSPPELFLIRQGFVSEESGTRTLTRETGEGSGDAFQGYVGNFPAHALDNVGDRIELTFNVHPMSADARALSFGFFAGGIVLEDAATMITDGWTGYLHQIGAGEGTQPATGGVFRQGAGSTGLMDHAAGGTALDGDGGTVQTAPIAATAPTPVLVRLERVSTTQLRLTTVFPSALQSHETTGTAGGLAYASETIDGLTTLRSWHPVNEGPVALNGFAIAARGNAWTLADLTLRLSGEGPLAPTDLTASAVSPTRIDLEWTDPNAPAHPAQSFRVERSPDGLAPWVLRALVNTPAFADTGLAPESTWHYRILAERAGSISDPSALVSATTPAATGGVAFADWIAHPARGVPADQRGPHDTPAGDGLPNLLKYAFGLEPAVPTAAPIQVHRRDHGIVLQYRVSDAVTGIIVTPIYSTTLVPGSWQAVPLENILNLGPDGLGNTVFEATLATGSGPLFLAVEVTIEE